MGVCCCSNDTSGDKPIQTVASSLEQHESTTTMTNLKNQNDNYNNTKDVSDEIIPIYFTKQEWSTLSKFKKIRNLYDSHQEIELILLNSFHYNHFDVNVMLTFYEVMADMFEIKQAHSSYRYDLDMLCEMHGRARIKQQQQLMFTNLIITGYIREMNKILHTKYDNTQYIIPPIHHIITSFYPLITNFVFEDILKGKYYTEIVSIGKCPQNIYNSTKDIENILYRMNLNTFDVTCGIMLYEIMSEAFSTTKGYDLELIAEIIVRLSVKIYPNNVGQEGQEDITTEYWKW
eukprot:382180_1